MIRLKGMIASKMRGSELVAILCSLLLVLSISACGKKGSPRPPQATAPKAIQFFTGEGRINGLLLTWQAPQETQRGEALVDLASFYVQRSNYIKGEQADFETIAELSLEDAAKGIAQISGVAKRYSYLDADVAPGKRYQYLVLPVNERGIEGKTGGTVRVYFAGESSEVEVF